MFILEVLHLSSFPFIFHQNLNKPSLFFGPILALIVSGIFSCFKPSQGVFDLNVFTIIFGEITDLYDVYSRIVGPMG